MDTKRKNHLEHGDFGDVIRRDERRSERNESPATLIVGFAAAMLLTLLAYVVVVQHLLSGWRLTMLILCLAGGQLAVQLIYFVHLNRGRKSYWNVLLVSFAVFVVCVVVAGSVWIMNNLNTRMSMQQMDNYMFSQDSL